MDYARRYIENEVLTSGPAQLTLIMLKNLLEKFDYIMNRFDETDIESFESETALEKLDKAERLVEELYAEIATFEESSFKMMAERYTEVVDGLIEFKKTYNKKLIEVAHIKIKAIKEAYEEVLKRGE